MIVDAIELMSLKRPLFRFDNGDGPFRSVAFTEACDALRAAVHRCESPIVLTGPAGAGKSVLLAELARQLADEGIKVAMFAAPAAVTADIDARVVIVDDADAGTPARLREIAEAARRRRASAIFAAVGEHIAAGAACAVRLPPMSGRELQDFLLETAARAGRPDLFSAAAQDAVVDAVHGIPRAAKRVANDAVMEALFEGARVVESRHVASAVAARLPLPPAEEDYSAEPPTIVRIEPVPAPPPLKFGDDDDDEVDEVDAPAMRPFKVDASRRVHLDARGVVLGGTALALLVATVIGLAYGRDLGGILAWAETRLPTWAIGAPQAQPGDTLPAALPTSLLTDPAVDRPLVPLPEVGAAMAVIDTPNIAEIEPGPTPPDWTTPGYRPPTPPMPSVEAARLAGIPIKD